MDCTRRRFIQTAAVSLAAPAIVRFDSLDRLVRPQPVAGYPCYSHIGDPCFQTEFATNFFCNSISEHIGEIERCMVAWGDAAVYPEKLADLLYGTSVTFDNVDETKIQLLS